MKVIELLMQGNKVWNKDKEGYFELDQRRNRLYFTDINTKRRKTYPNIVLELALREGEIYTETECKNIPFGTKVRGWNEGDAATNVGKFLAYDANDTDLPFFIFLEQDMQARWFRHCELLVEEDE